MTASAAPVCRDGSYRLAQVANFLSPSSGGLGGVVQAVGLAHLGGGGARLLVTPASRTQAVRQPVRTPGHLSPADPSPADPPPSDPLGDPQRRTPEPPDRWLGVHGPVVPCTRGQYRVLVRRAPVVDALDAFEPQVVQIHDQTTLAWVAGWARRRGVPTVVFAHEHLHAVAAEAVRGLPDPWTRAAVRRWLSWLAARADAVVCASAFAARPFEEAGATNVRRVPLGVDLGVFRPRPGGDPDLPWRQRGVRLIQVARLYPEKRPELGIDALAALRDRGIDGELVVVGTGPLRESLRERAARTRLPVRFLGHVADRDTVARLTAGADVALCPGPRETFGLAVLEAMAAGTPVVTSDQGAAPELLSPGAGLTARSARDVADAVARLLGDPLAGRLARRRAEEFSWSRATGCLRDLELSLLDRAGVPRRRAQDRSGAAPATRRPR